MASEARNQINNNYDEFFYVTMCHVCKRFGDDVPLKRCSSCKMIFYCGEDHQKQHWKKHKPLCRAIQDVLQDYSMDYNGDTTEEWIKKKLMFISLVSSRMGRYLNMGEIQMFCFPRECLVCYERNNLMNCQKCAASFCQNHKDGIKHRGICAPLELRLCTDLFSLREGNSPLNLHFNLQHISSTSTFQDMKDFIKAFGNMRTVRHSEMSYNILEAQHSEYLTCSLTLFHAMRLLNVPKSKKLVIHVLATSKSEEIFWTVWGILPRLTETMVTVIVIGPGLSNLLNCDNCMSREKEYLTFKFHDVFYENYVRSSSFVKPDLVVGFNLYIHNHKLPGRSSNETWAPPIQILAKQNCPFVLTSATLYSFRKETDMINTILNKKVDHLYRGKNPFACLKPYKTIDVECVSFINQYIIIYRSLCF